MITNRRLLLAMFAAASVGLSGCATQNEKPAGVIADASEYEWVTPLGSNVPVRVRKGTTAQTASPTSTMTGDQAAAILHSAGNQVKVEKGSP